MKLIPLSQKSTRKNKDLNLSAIVDDWNYDWLMRYIWYAKKAKRTYYAARNEGGKTIRMHRFIMNINDSNIKIDHKNRNGLDCQELNLRTSNNSENGANTNSRINSTSKYLGVCLNKKQNKFISQIGKNGKVIYIGIFENEIEAAKAYNTKAIELHGEFANLNLIETL